MRVGGRLVRGLQSEYLNGVIAETKVDPDSFSFYELMDIIRQMGYGLTDSNGVTEHVTVYYKLQMPDIGLVNLTSHYDMLEMFAVHSSGKKYMVIDLYVDCPSVVESDEDREPEVEVICRDSNTAADPSSLTELGGGLEIGNGQGGGELRGIEHVEEPVVDEEGKGVGNECVNANEDGERVGDEMDEDSESDCEWQPNDDSETSCDSFSGVEESSNDEEKENIALDMEVAMEVAMEVIGGRGSGCGRMSTNTTVKQQAEQDMEVAMEMVCGRGSGNGRGRGGIGGKSGRGGIAVAPYTSKARGDKTKVVGGTGRGGDPTSKHVNPNVRGRGRGRGRGESIPALPGIVIKERSAINEDSGGGQRTTTIGKGKEVVVGKTKGKQPIVRFGGTGQSQPVTTSIAPRVGLPLPQGWMRSTRIGNAMFWSQPTGSSAASCGSGSTTGSATMPSTGPRQLSQGESSTPGSTQKSNT
ncbi:hypothetical protein RHGRI_025382 [Rhododendron griersonianum]|uniref:Uncharacterized protein n=1 Tax=Rhododendron griersonianum TaxID=479676 RepID=A0AAV6INT7_9ERIC|nr:hypothetical protein RHGRI_025382 [Rhododendron griersonianum]